VKNRTSWTDKNGSHEKKYKPDDFDYYALYLPHLDKVVYPSIKFGGCCITTELPLSPTPFYWWEDFTDFTDDATKRSYKEFGIDLTTRKVNPESRIHTRKVERPSKEELEKMVWEKPTAQIARDFEYLIKRLRNGVKVTGLKSHLEDIG
jgi:hypothetical protein